MWVGKKGCGKHSIALLFWQSTDSGDYLEQLLVEHKGLLIGVDQSSPYAQHATNNIVKYADGPLAHSVSLCFVSLPAL